MMADSPESLCSAPITTAMTMAFRAPLVATMLQQPHCVSLPKARSARRASSKGTSSSATCKSPSYSVNALCDAAMRRSWRWLRGCIA